MLVFLAIVVVFLLAVIGVMGYGIWNLLQKNEELEDSINEFYARTNATVRYMRFLDEKQMFEKDDEVGDVFKLLVETVDKLYGFVTEIRDDNTEEKG
jgi:predicted negative regulator of RcsB-dependent stress response